MKEAVLVSRRLVYEGVVGVCGLLKVDINMDNIHFCNKARVEYNKEPDYLRELQAAGKKMEARKLYWKI